MFLAMVLGCNCSGDPTRDLPKTEARRPTLVVPHEPAALVPYPKCVAYHAAVCEVCGSESEPCSTLRKVTDLCAQRGTCNEESCEAGTKKLRADPKGAQSEMCTE